MQDKSHKRNLAFLAFVLIAATAYYLFVSQGTPSLRFSAEKRLFSFVGAKHTAVVFSFDTLEALEFHEGDAAAFGAPVTGGQVYGGYAYGTWKSEPYGEYEAFVSMRIPAFILAKDQEKSAVFNVSNTETTRSLYEQLYAFWQSQPSMQ
ncbi:MAG: hypothetical protein IJ865_10295 [Clostridia bacterium]|nr:hypothetical protein [Clostridia bacterium]